MTAFVPDVPLRVLATVSGTRALRLEHLEAHPGIGDLEMVCTGMGMCDSAGLSALRVRRAAERTLPPPRRSADLDVREAVAAARAVVVPAAERAKIR